MRITQIRDDGKVNTLRTLKIEQLVEQMKVETKAQLVSAMREVLPYILPGDKNDYVQKVPKLLPAAAFVRKNGIMTMDEYNGIVMLQVNNLSGRMEADEVKERVKELPQTYLAFNGSSDKTVKIWVRFTYSNDQLPVDREQAELFHAHAYRLAVKFYQPQLPFDIELKEPSPPSTYAASSNSFGIVRMNWRNKKILNIPPPYTLAIPIQNHVGTIIGTNVLTSPNFFHIMK